jgi:putative ABC transport system permease protein
METLLRDIRFGFRQLRKTPGAALTAIVAIALGISANTTIFSSADALILRPFSFPNQDRLVMLYEQDLEAGMDRGPVSPGNFAEWKKRNQSLQELVAMTGVELDFTAGDRPERHRGYSVTTNFFDALGIKAAKGRAFMREDGARGRENVVVLKHDFWQTYFGADPNVIGKTVTVSRLPYTIIGVTPPDFNFPCGACQMYIPKVIDAEMENTFGDHFLSVIGLLKPDVSIKQCEADLRVITEQLQKEQPGMNRGLTSFVNSMTAEYTRGMWLYLQILTAAVIFILLIACANVANLQLVRASARQKEIAVRLALGASRWGLFRQLLTESVMIALIGGGLGLAMAVWGVKSLARGLPEGISKYVPGWDHMGINGVVLLFTLLVSVLTGILFGLVPAWQATKIDMNEKLKEESNEGVVGKSARNITRNALIVFEIALSIMLLVGAGLMVRSFIKVMQTDFGIAPENVITLSIELSDQKYGREEQRHNFLEQLVQSVESVPNVASIGAVNHSPMSGSSSFGDFQIVGQPAYTEEKEPQAEIRLATPGYFNAIGTKLRRGRLFNDQDTGQTIRVALVNESLASRFFSDRDAVGQRLTINNGASLKIVGVVSNVMNDEIDDAVKPGIYLPYTQSRDWTKITLVARGKSDPLLLIGAFRDRIATLDRNLAVSNIKTLKQAISERTSPKRIMMWLMAIFGSLALVLAAVGVYAVMAYAVAQRVREIGVRIALGARPGNILKLIIGQAMLLTAVGVSIGVAGAFLLSSAIAGLLYGVTAADPVTFIGIPALLVAIILVACFIPARGAMKVDPIVALRYK